MKKIIKAAHDDPDHSVDLFDGERVNQFGEIFCVEPAILLSEVDSCWKRYQKKYETSFEGEKPFGSPGSGREL